MTFISGEFKIVCDSHEQFLVIRAKYFPQVARGSWKLMKVKL